MQYFLVIVQGILRDGCTIYHGIWTFSRVWINAGGVIENIPVNITNTSSTNTTNSSSTAPNKRGLNWLNLLETL